MLWILGFVVGFIAFNFLLWYVDDVFGGRF